MIFYNLFLQGLNFGAFKLFQKWSNPVSSGFYSRIRYQWIMSQINNFLWTIK